ncbi:hypothetical protein EF888_19475 [Silicimonas algicola]|uniref:Uncharacterized protein n=1 Tax=Silicimonas algicola TaxID=1826607 RepID=A0A316GJT7_9RHOB|nr:hypothetical protein [Silicimonas algicola]AZQ69116.1 hypothetical protein EF888_19475 [Silicimonas algicola]PWK55077.1 hypothetical protein C8D95_109165 [Silicimonas algicola]
MSEDAATDGAMSEAAMLASLHDIRLPASAAGGAFADVAAAGAIACVAAILVLGLLRLFTVRRSRGLSEDPLPLANGLTDADRRVALLHRLKRFAPDIFSRLRARLYRPGAVTLEEIEREAARHV